MPDGKGSAALLPAPGSAHCLSSLSRPTASTLFGAWLRPDLSRQRDESEKDHTPSALHHGKLVPLIRIGRRLMVLLQRPYASAKAFDAELHGAAVMAMVGSDK